VLRHFLYAESETLLPEIKCRDSSIVIAKDWTAGVRFLAVARKFSVVHVVKTGSGAHPTSYPMGTTNLSPGVKRPERENKLSSPSNAEVKNGGALPLLPHDISTF
jgi:hypothetical protein